MSYAQSMLKQLLIIKQSCCTNFLSYPKFVFFFHLETNLGWKIKLVSWLQYSATTSVRMGVKAFREADFCYMGFPSGVSGKDLACQCRRHKRHRFDPWVRKIPWGRKWQPTPVFWPGKSHGQRWATVHRVSKSQTWLKRLRTHACGLASVNLITKIQHFTNLGSMNYTGISTIRCSGAICGNLFCKHTHTMMELYSS